MVGGETTPTLGRKDPHSLRRSLSSAPEPLSVFTPVWGLGAMVLLTSAGIACRDWHLLPSMLAG